jgi:hypothetical protein
VEAVDAADVDLPYPHYRCPVCGKELPLSEARMTVTCAEHGPAEAPEEWELRDAVASDRAGIEEICDRVWGETEIDAFGRTFDVLECQLDTVHARLHLDADDRFHVLPPGRVVAVHHVALMLAVGAFHPAGVAGLAVDVPGAAGLDQVGDLISVRVE